MLIQVCLIFLIFVCYRVNDSFIMFPIKYKGSNQMNHCFTNFVRSDYYIWYPNTIYNEWRKVAWCISFIHSIILSVKVHGLRWPPYLSWREKCDCFIYDNLSTGFTASFIYVILSGILCELVLVICDNKVGRFPFVFGSKPLFSSYFH